jgi:serine/threonine protein kinase
LAGPLRLDRRIALLLEPAGDQTLADVLRDRPRLSLDLLERWEVDLLEAIVELDRAGVDHRDIKPANLGVREQRGNRTKHLQRFLSGEPDYSWNDEWAAMMRRRTADGQRMERVRIVSEPHGDYTRFMLDLAQVNVEAGEDIRYLPRNKANSLDLPAHDFWLIDSTKVGILHFGDDDILLGAEISTDPAVVVRHCYFRDVARHYATPFREYMG